MEDDFYVAPNLESSLGIDILAIVDDQGNVMGSVSLELRGEDDLRTSPFQIESRRELAENANGEFSVPVEMTVIGLDLKMSVRSPQSVYTGVRSQTVAPQVDVDKVFVYKGTAPIINTPLEPDVNPGKFGDYVEAVLVNQFVSVKGKDVYVALFSGFAQSR
ncbi:MAG: hypothetical protein R2688_01220 [Fimbriimonadaceae bacterium]